MTISLRQGAIFASGILLGAAAAVWVVRGVYQGTPGAPDRREAAQPTSQPSAVAMRQAAKAPQPAATGTAAAPPTPHAACPAQAVATTTAGGKDGQFVLQTNIDAKTAVDIPSFILAGKEAAAAGRSRDAEVAFLMACRVADALRGADSVDAADARYQLARHYAALAQAGGTASGTRVELSGRAEALYADSLATYRAKYGDKNEKSRFAAEGLASVRQTPSALRGGSAVAPVAAAQVPAARVQLPASSLPTKPAPPAAPAIVAAATPQPLALPLPLPAATTRSVSAKPPLPAPRRTEVSVVEPAVRQATGQASLQSPSFDCAKARSRPEQIICSDTELARLDRELGRLHARARAASPDPAAFRRQNEQEWRNREANCRDRECLLGWYAHRRDQLLDDLDAAAETRPPTAYR